MTNDDVKSLSLLVVLSYVILDFLHISDAIFYISIGLLLLRLAYSTLVVILSQSPEYRLRFITFNLDILCYIAGFLYQFKEPNSWVSLPLLIIPFSYLLETYEDSSV